MYYASSLFKLSSPLDLLRFKPLSLAGRLRLGRGLLRARSIERWQDLDDKPATNWLRDICGEEAYRVVWDPLLRGKFGNNAELISAAWFWSKLRLRGGSRSKRGHEELVYFKGGFAALADDILRHIEASGGRVITRTPVTALLVSNGRIAGVVAGETSYPVDAVILTTPLPVAAQLLAGVAPDAYCRRLGRIRFLANRCLVLEIDRALSELYWINVNDPSFPFVGVIEHTNFVDDAAYAGRHLVYLSRYCAPDDLFLSLSLQEAVAFALPHLKRMFPAFDSRMVLRAHSWQAPWAQPVVEVGYSKLIPGHQTPLRGLYLATMAQVYPEDRGTNYAVRDGRKVACLLARQLAESCDELRV
jgi:protoporphyrinogen oxidase